MDLDWTQETAGPVTLVRARLRNERATDRHVSLRNRLDGPVLPPRRRGTAESGWNRDGLTTQVPAGETVALGYACPASATDPPVEIVDVESAAEREPPEISAADAVRTLGDHRPPRAVLGGETVGGTAETGDRTAGTVERTTQGAPDTDQCVDSRVDGDSTDHEPEPRSPAAPLPADATELLSQYRTRIRTVEALSATGVEEATALLETNGGLAGIESVATGLDDDARELRELARTAATLAARAEAATPPIDALRRLS